jgi:hypothetical protein
MNTKRATVYLEPDLHKGLRIKAAQSDRTISDLVNEAVRISLAEDLVDLEAFEERANEPNIPFEKILKSLSARGKI